MNYRTRQTLVREIRALPIFRSAPPRDLAKGLHTAHGHLEQMARVAFATVAAMTPAERSADQGRNLDLVANRVSDISAAFANMAVLIKMIDEHLIELSAMADERHNLSAKQD